jgi:hypothetical protein
MLVEDVKQKQRERRAAGLVPRTGGAIAPPATGDTGGGGPSDEASNGEAGGMYAYSVHEELGKVFEAIDPLRELFAELSWQAPRVGDQTRDGLTHRLSDPCITSPLSS